jgi:hypothetical protein
MSTKQFLNRFIKRANFLEDYTQIDEKAQRGGFNHRYTGKDTNGNESDLNVEDKIQIHDGLGGFIIDAIAVRQKLGEEIKEHQANPENEAPQFESLEGLQSLTEFHHSGNELVVGMPVLLERNRRTPLKAAILKSWEIGEVKNDLTGYGKYSASTVTMEGEDKPWPFTMVFHKKA